MRVEVKTKRHIQCPNGCSHEFEIEYRFKDIATRRIGCS